MSKNAVEKNKKTAPSSAKPKVASKKSQKVIQKTKLASAKTAKSSAASASSAAKAIKKQKKVEILKDKMMVEVSWQSLQQTCALFRMFQGNKIRINGFRPGKEPWVLIYNNAADQINQQAVYASLSAQLSKNHKDRELKAMDFKLVGPAKQQSHAFCAEVTYSYSKKTVKTKT
jgi:hypothetical protein